VRWGRKSWICQADAYSLTDCQTAEIFRGFHYREEVSSKEETIFHQY
jgi:hypothetical protein